MKRLSAIVLLLTGLAAYASEPVATGVGNAGEFAYHARYSLEGKGRHVIAMTWPDDSDSSRYTATAEISASAYDDPLFPAKASYTVFRESAGGRELFAGGDFDCRSEADPAFSMVIRRSHSGTTLSLGSDKAAATIEIPFCGDSIYTRAIEGAELLRHSLIIRSVGAKPSAPFENREDLMKYLEASSDPMETVWEYLDRDINTAEARLGGKYTVATVLSPDGYDIVYLDGGENSPGEWQSLDIKGRLRKTAFIGHYDLEWLAAQRHMADSEASATIGVGGEVLELNFPTLRSRLRFRRAKR